MGSTVNIPSGDTIEVNLDQTNDEVLIYGYDGGTNRAVKTDSDGNLQVDILSGAGGTQYTEGDTDATITGTAAMMEVAVNTLQPVQGTVADGLLVNLGTNNDVTVTGTVTANAGTNLNTSLLALETGGNLAAAATSLATLDNIVSGSEAQVDVITQPARSHATDSIRIGDGTDLALVNAAGALHVDGSAVTQPISGTVTATATDLDIRNLVQATDSVSIGDGTSLVGVLTDGADNVVNTNNQLIVAAMGYVFDGATWDRALGNSTDGTLVNLGTNNDVTITSGTITTVSALGVGTTGPQKAEDVAHATGDMGIPAWCVANEANTAFAADGDYVPTASDTEGNTRVVGNRDHDAVDAGEVVKIGGVAVSGSATPTSVAAADRTRWIFNQHGIPYIIGGHPNLITREFDFGTAAQTDLNLAAAVVAADERIYVTLIDVMCDKANSVNVSARVGFGTASVPTASATGVSGMIGSHPGIAPGSGFVRGTGAGVIAVGAAGEEPRITTSAATSGNTHVTISYYLVDETP